MNTQSLTSCAESPRLYLLTHPQSQTTPAHAQWWQSLVATLISKQVDCQAVTTWAEFEEGMQATTPSVWLFDAALNQSHWLDWLNHLSDSQRARHDLIWLASTDQLSQRMALYQQQISVLLDPALPVQEVAEKVYERLAMQQADAYRVLLLDDSEVVLQIQAALLKQAGFEVQAFSQPDQAFAALDSFAPDVLVLDLYMPEVSGQAFAWAVRQGMSDAQLPIIFVSAEDAFSHQLAALQQGGDDFLVKPVKPNELVEKVRLRAHRARQYRYLSGNIKQTLYEQQRLNEALDHHAIVSVADRAGRIIMVNDRFCQTSGYSREALMGQTHRIVKSDYHSPAFFKTLWRTIASGQSWQGEVCNRAKSGRYYWVYSTITPFLDERGRVYQYVSIRTDITHVKNIEQELVARVNELHQRVRETSSLTGVMQTLADESLDHEAWLQQAIEQMQQGFERSAMTAVQLLWADQRFEAPADEGDHTAQPKVTQVDLHPQGTLKVLRWPESESESGAGATKSADGVTFSETEQTLLQQCAMQLSQALGRRQDQAEMKAARFQAEKASQAKSDFLSSMTHELRTPLNAIIGFSQLLASEGLPAPAPDHLHVIERSAQHLLRLIEDVLAFARMESGQQACHLVATDISQVVAEAVAIVESDAMHQGITVHAPSLTRLPAVMCDPMRLKQVLLNLLSNAIKYNRSSGQVWVDWALRSTPQPVGCLSVTDNGVGMNAAQLAQLFEPFERLGYENSSVQGTGIGLSLSKDLVEQMQGWIEVDSTPQQGSCFRVCLPLAPKTDADADAAFAPRSDADSDRADDAASSPSPGAHQPRILVVAQDPQWMAQMAAKVAEAHPCELKVAPGLVFAQTLIQDWTPEGVLVDLAVAQACSTAADCGLAAPETALPIWVVTDAGKNSDKEAAKNDVSEIDWQQQGFAGCLALDASDASWAQVIFNSQEEVSNA